MKIFMKKLLIILFCLLYLSLIVGTILVLFVHPNVEIIPLYILPIFGATFMLLFILSNIANHEKDNKKIEDKIKKLENKIEQFLNSSKNE